MKKILHIVAGMNLGGTETYLMNIYRNINHEKVQFHFLTYYENNEYGYYDQEILQLGGEIHNLTLVKKAGPVKALIEIRQLLKTENYWAVHAHTTYNIGFSMLAAKLEGINIRIAHSHNTGVGKNSTFIKLIYQSFMRILINKFANRFCACSLKAAEHLFTSDNIEKNYTYIPNAVDLNKFLNNDCNNSKLKKEIKIPLDAKVIGHVGRYGKAKNHKFIISMFNQLLKKKKDIYLILIGEGATREDIEKQIDILGIGDNVKVLGLRTDIAELMGIMDVFILPSLYEGFGIVLLEAQSSGLPCIVSENIQPEPDMYLGLMNWVNLNDTEKWITTIEENLDKKITEKILLKKNIEQSPFQLKEVVDKFYKLYEIKGLI